MPPLRLPAWTQGFLHFETAQLGLNSCRWQGWCYEQPTPGWSGPKQVDENTWQVAKAVWGKPKDVLGPKSKCTKRQKPTKARRASAASTVAKPSAKAGSNMTELQHFTALTMETRQPQSNQMASSPFASPRQRWGSIQKDTAQRPCMAASEVRSESSSEDLSSPSGSGLGCQQPSTGEEPRRWGTQPSTEGACSEEVEDVTLQQRWGSLAGGKQGAHQHRVAQEACADVLSGSSTASSADDRPPQAFHAYQQNGIYRGNFRKVGKRLYKCS